MDLLGSLPPPCVNNTTADSVTITSDYFHVPSQSIVLLRHVSTFIRRCGSIVAKN